VIKFDQQALLTAMKKLLASPELCRIYGENGKKLVKENYLWDKVARRYEELYSDVMRGKD
jgi:glycosyltransferase involved in cell wall biosynthesis